MAVFEVTRNSLEKFVDLQIEKNPELDEFREDLLDMLTCNTLDLSDAIREDMESDSSWPYENKEPSQLYIRDSRYHIRIKDLVIDFFENVFTGVLLDAMLYMFHVDGIGKVSSVKITRDFILFVKRVVKEYVVKLDNIQFCIYLQAITHFKEHQVFSINNLMNWLPETSDDLCNMYSNRWYCSYRNGEKCNFDKSCLENILQKMESRNIIKYCEDNMYKINY